jgi:hypothetical protein
MVAVEVSMGENHPILSKKKAVMAEKVVKLAVVLKFDRFGQYNEVAVEIRVSWVSLNLMNAILMAELLV